MGRRPAAGAEAGLDHSPPELFEWRLPILADYLNGAFQGSVVASLPLSWTLTTEQIEQAVAEIKAKD
ncbi:MAG TPA: hypothetical protein VNL74_08840 [Methylococcus sp.]|nr:hypothetical protein [Methylococcus sp.]